MPGRLVVAALPLQGAAQHQPGVGVGRVLRHEGAQLLLGPAELGGVGHVWGALMGAGVVVIMKDQLQVWLPRLLGGSGNGPVKELA